MIKVFAYNKKDNACILKMNDVVKMEDKGAYIEFTDKTKTVVNVEKKPYKIRIYHN